MPGLILGFGATGEAVAQLQRDLGALGYGLEQTGVYDARTKIVVEAFQRRWRPQRIDGVADAGTRATIGAALPVA